MQTQSKHSTSTEAKRALRGLAIGGVVRFGFGLLPSSSKPDCGGGRNIPTANLRWSTGP